MEKKSELDLQWVRKEAEQRSSLKLILYCPNWLQLWNLALDSGPHGTRCGQCLERTLTKPIFGNRQCSKCCNTIVQEVYLDRLFHDHADQLNVKETYNVVIQALKSCSQVLLSFGARLISLEKGANSQFE